ncbi:hypothetical protein OUZ56_015935 [Daphnia magna]|uniref:Uncharacterized protein n=1 Tax=Daphnia magna TaxID=35525 RepID=A0ABR0AP90_9CRUS|nr:hypothetical protein OUZ56_015935 [Daphnia magna]
MVRSSASELCDSVILSSVFQSRIRMHTNTKFSYDKGMAQWYSSAQRTGSLMFDSINMLILRCQ